MPKKPYASPDVVAYRSLDAVPEHLRAAALKLTPADIHHADVRPQFTVTVSLDRKYTQVSDEFCRLLGRRREELIGHRYDEFTAPNTVDIESVHGVFLSTGYNHGLWLLVHRSGTRILVRFDGQLRGDHVIARMELVGTGY